MVTAFELAGSFAAHAVWCVSDGATLTPMLAYTTEEGERHMDRLAGGEISQVVAEGQNRLSSNPMNADDAALLYDGRITLGRDKVDAVIVEVRAYFSPGSRATLAVPYSPKTWRSKFRVHRPKLLAWDDCEDFDLDTVLEAFFRGVGSHEKGAAVWNASLDESK